MATAEVVSASRPHPSFATGAHMAGQKERLLRPAAALVVGVGRQPDGRGAISPSAFAEKGDRLRLGLSPAALAHGLVDTIEKGDLVLERNRVR